MFSENIIKALDFANLAHRNQKRKNTEKPYIIHPFMVGMLLANIRWNEETVIAGILHDVVEDTEVTMDEIKKEFGEKVAKIIAGVSEPDKGLSWEERKEHTLNELSNESIEVKLVACADKFHNIYTIKEEQKAMGDRVFERFNRPKEKQEWYYRGLVDALSELSGNEMYEKFKKMVEEVFQNKNI